MNGPNAAAPVQTLTPNPYVPLPLDALPSIIPEYVTDVAALIGCDPAAIAVPLLACFGGAIGSKRILRLPDGRCEPATIWTGVIDAGDSASRKAFEAGTAPARRKQLEAFALDAAAIQQHKSDMADYEHIKLLRERLNPSRSRLHRRPTKPTASLADHRVLSHVSPAALVARLPASPDGLLMFSEELAGWFARCSSREDYSAHLHSMWSGEPLIRELAKKTVLIERPSVSMAGRIRLESLSGVLAREHNEDAPITRLLVAMPPPPQRLVQWPETTINPAVEAKFSELFDKLWGLETPRDDNNRPRPVEVELSPEAHGEWIQFCDRHRVEQAGLSGYLAGVSASLEAYALRFALVLHLCRWAEGQTVDPARVDAESLRAAVRLVDWFWYEARRVYGVLTTAATDDSEKRALDLARRKGGRLTARQLCQFDHRFRNDPAGARAELERMVESGQGHWETGRTRRFVPSDVVSERKPQPQPDVQM